MKKSTKILGSVALSAALVMGTAAPAFANTSAVSGDNKATYGADTNLTQGTDKSQGTGETAVNITTYTSQITVTVPMSLTLSLDTTGGMGYAPTNYKIKNGTVVPIKVESATATPAAAGKYGFGTVADKTAGAAAVSSGTIGDVYAKLAPKAGQTGVTGSAAVELEATKTGAQTLDWVIGAKPAGSTVTVTGYKYGSTTYTTSAADALACANAIIAGEAAGWTSTKQGNLTTAANTGWDALITRVQGYIADGDLSTAIDPQTTGSASTDLELDIEAASSILKNAEATTNNAAKIVYTVKVA